MKHRCRSLAGALAATAITATLAAPASASSLAADSLLCESADTLVYVGNRDEFKGLTASAVKQRAQAGMTAFKSNGPALDTVGTVARTRTTPLGEDNTIAIASTCVASGARAAAKVVEQRATLGLVKVQTVYEGRRIERWAFASALSD